MEEKTVPWWRRALNFALGGIRSGFGLFSRHAKDKTTEEPENFAGQEENPDKEAELTEDSPKLEKIVEAANEAEAVSTPFPTPEIEVAAEPVVAPATGGAADMSTAAIESIAAAVEPIAEPTPSPIATPAPVVEPDSEKEMAAEAEPELEAETELEATPETELKTEEAPEAEQAAGIAPDPQPEPEVEAAVEAVPVNEPFAEPVAEDEPEETVVESPAPIEAPAEPATEPEVVEAAIDAPEVVAIPSQAIADEALPEPEVIEVPHAETETPVEPIAEVEAVHEPVEEMIEPAEQTVELDAEPEPETFAEPFEIEEPAPVEEPLEEQAPTYEFAPETVAASVESMESALEDAQEQTVLQPTAVEEESTDEAALVDEPELEIEPAAELDAAQETEPTNPAKELMEPTPEQIPEPEEVSDATPIEDAASEPVSEAELPTPAAEELATEAIAEPAPEIAEPAIPTEQPAELQAEQPAVEVAAEAAVEPVAEPAVEPVSEAAVEPVVETASEPLAEAAADTSAAPSTDEPDEPTLAPTAAPHPAKPFIKLETRDNEADLSPFSVVVSQVYDGPLDLLLDLIRKQDIDVYDIPIARITAQFLAYVNQLKATDVDVAGEFIYMASLLIHIKSKMLLPRAPTGPDEAPEDPRRELVERLLEHERFKNAAQMLQQKQMLEAASWTNPGIREFQDDTDAEPEIAADTVDLVRIFRDILERARNRPVIDLQEDSVTVGQMIQFLSRRLTMEDKPIALRRLLSHTKSERALIAMFLALLELVRLQAILLRQDLAFSEIFIKKHTGFESVMNEGLANARDDWK